VMSAAAQISSTRTCFLLPPPAARCGKACAVALPSRAARCSNIGCNAGSREEVPKGPGSTGESASEFSQDPMALLRELLGSPDAGADPVAGGNGFASLSSLLGNMGGNQGKNSPDLGVDALFGMGSSKQKATDAFFTDRVPVLQTIKRPVVATIFAIAFWRGWVGRWGLLQGLTSSSYFDLLGVPLRILPRSPLCGRPFFVTKVWTDTGFRLMGFLLNWARGKTTLKDVFKPPSGMAWPSSADPEGMAGDARPSLVDIPTMKTSASPAHKGQPLGDSRPAERTSSPTIIDADVTFLD